MSAGRERYEFTADEITELLAQLDHRLQRRGVAASVFVVGGAAVAVAGVRRGRLTEDVDATKLIAQRAKDADDVVALARRLGMLGPVPMNSRPTSAPTTRTRCPWDSSSTATT